MADKAVLYLCSYWCGKYQTHTTARATSPVSTQGPKPSGIPNITLASIFKPICQNGGAEYAASVVKTD